MVAAYVSASHQTYSGGSSTTAVLPSPSGATAGDLAIVVLQLESGIKTITKPTGWTEEAQNASGSTMSSYILWKYLTGSEVAADRTFSWTGGCWRTADMILIRGGVTSGNPFGGTIGEATGTTGTSRSSVAYTTSGAGLGFWLHANFADNSTITLPSGYTTRVSSDDHCFEFSTRTDTAGSKTSGTATGPSAAWIVFAQTILDTAGGTDGTVAAIAATATATAVAPAASSDAAVTGVTATATADTPAAVVSAGSEVVAVAATATSEALAPAVTADGAVVSVPATATSEALPPVVDGGGGVDGSVAAVVATATALAEPPSVASETVIIGAPAAATATAHAPVVTADSSAVATTATAIAHSQYGPDFHSPLVITTGGTYTGVAVNLTPGEVAVTISTTEPVTLVDMDIYSIGAGIEAPNTGTQLTIQNCYFEALTPDITIREQQCIRAWQPHTLIFENNTSENAHGVQISGGGYVSTTIRIDKNYFHNIGRLSQPSNYQGAVHLDNVQCPGMTVMWNEVFNERGLSHSEDTIACSNGTAGASGDVIEVAYNLINGTYPISGDGTSFTGGAYDLGDIDGGYIEAHHNYAINYTNNGFMIPSGHDITIRDCVAVYDGLDDQGVQCSTAYGWGFTVANLYGGGVSPNTFLQDNRSAHRRWDGFWDDADYQWNDANLGDQDLGGNTVLGTGSASLEQDAIDEWEALVAANGITIGAAAPRALFGIAPTVAGGATAQAAVATATALAYPPVVSGETTAVDVNVDAVVATATALAEAPEIASEIVLEGAEAATATAMAHPPVVTASSFVDAPVIFMQARCHVPTVDTTVATFRFEPPTHEAPMRSPERIHQFFRLTHAASVVRVNGVLTTIHQPRPDQIAAAGVEGVDYFLGGRVYDVSAAVKAELLAAGFPVG